MCCDFLFCCWSLGCYRHHFVVVVVWWLLSSMLLLSDYQQFAHPNMSELVYSIHTNLREMHCIQHHQRHPYSLWIHPNSLHIHHHPTPQTVPTQNMPQFDTFSLRATNDNSSPYHHLLPRSKSLHIRSNHRFSNKMDSYY